MLYIPCNGSLHRKIFLRTSWVSRGLMSATHSNHRRNHSLPTERRFPRCTPFLEFEISQSSFFKILLTSPRTLCRHPTRAHIRILVRPAASQEGKRSWLPSSVPTRMCIRLTQWAKPPLALCKQPRICSYR